MAGKIFAPRILRRVVIDSDVLFALMIWPQYLGTVVREVFWKNTELSVPSSMMCCNPTGGRLGPPAIVMKSPVVDVIDVSRVTVVAPTCGSDVILAVPRSVVNVGSQ